MNVSKHILNINIASISQNFLRTDQYQHSCLACTVAHIRESVKASHIHIQSTLTRFGSTDVFWHPTKISLSYKSNIINVCHRTKINPENKIYLHLFSWSLSHSSSRHRSMWAILLTMFWQPSMWLMFEITTLRRQKQKPYKWDTFKNQNIINPLMKMASY